MYHVRVKPRHTQSMTSLVAMSELKARGRLAGSVFRANSLVRVQQIARRLRTVQELG